MRHKRHCWKDKGTWHEEIYGFLSPEHIRTAFVEPGGTCMLPYLHDGPHEWTPDDEVGVTFAPTEKFS